MNDLHETNARFIVSFFFRLIHRGERGRDFGAFILFSLYLYSLGVTKKEQ